MNQENRDKVNNYLNSSLVDSLSPLYFNGYESPKDEFDPDKYSIEKMIERVLLLSREYSSYDRETKECETGEDRWRSVIDIWRHIIYYYPNIEIFDVMRGIYNIRYNLGGQFCTTVLRRTFRFSLPGEECTHSRFQKAREMTGYYGKPTDEFDLVWDDWKDI